MPHTPKEKKLAITRLRRIRGQAEALERAIEDEVECGALLQQMAALRGAVNGLISDILEGHLRETFDPQVASTKMTKKIKQQRLESALALVRSYLK